METPINLTTEEEDAIKSLQLKIRNLRFLQILNIEDLSDDMRKSLWDKKLIDCGIDGWFLTSEGRVIRDMLFPDNI